MIAGDQLEPYMVRLRLGLEHWGAQPDTASSVVSPVPKGRRVNGGEVSALAVAVETLLEGVALRCEQAGASIIGHVKCYVHPARGPKLACSLTSTAAGASCRPASSDESSVAPADLDVVVLVYGLEYWTVGSCVDEAIESLRRKGASLDRPA